MILAAVEFRHVSVVVVNSNGNVAGEYGRFTRDDLASSQPRHHEATQESYCADSRKRQFLIEASDFDGWQPVLASREEHGVEAVLDTRKDLRIALEDFDNPAVCLLDVADRTSQHFRPSRKVGSAMRRAQEQDASSQDRYVSKMGFRPLSRDHQGILTHQATEAVTHKDDGAAAHASVPPIRGQRCEEVQGVVSNAVLRDQSAPIDDIGIVSEGQNAGAGHFRREEGLRPRCRSALGRPRPLAVARQAVDEDDAGGGKSRQRMQPLRARGLLLLGDAVLRVVQDLDPRGEGRRWRRTVSDCGGLRAAAWGRRRGFVPVEETAHGGE